MLATKLVLQRLIFAGNDVTENTLTIFSWVFYGSENSQATQFLRDIGKKLISRQTWIENSTILKPNRCQSGQN